MHHMIILMKKKACIYPLVCSYYASAVLDTICGSYFKNNNDLIMNMSTMYRSFEILKFDSTFQIYKAIFNEI